MNRSPQKITQDEGSHTYLCEIKGQRYQVKVIQEEYETWQLKGKLGDELQELLEAILHHRQQAMQSKQQPAKQSSNMAASTTATDRTATATMTAANTDSTPARPTLPPRKESMTMPTAEAPQYSSTPMNNVG